MLYFLQVGISELFIWSFMESQQVKNFAAFSTNFKFLCLESAIDDFLDNQQSQKEQNMSEKRQREQFLHPQEQKIDQNEIQEMMIFVFFQWWFNFYSKLEKALLSEY